MPVGRVAVAVVAWVVAALLSAVPVVAADDRPALHVSPTRPLDLAGLTAGETTRASLGVRNRSAEPVRVRLDLGELERPPRPVTVTVTRDDVIVWSGPVRALRADPVLPGELAPGETWDLGVRATATGAAAGAVGEVEVLGAQATRGRTGTVPDVTSSRPGEPSGGVALSAAALDPEGHQVPARVLLLSWSLLAAGVLWLALAIRHDGRRRARR